MSTRNNNETPLHPDAPPLAPARGDCAACAEQRMHTDDEWQHHPFHRHGKHEGGWTHPDLAKARQV